MPRLEAEPSCSTEFADVYDLDQAKDFGPDKLVRKRLFRLEGKASR